MFTYSYARELHRQREEETQRRTKYAWLGREAQIARRDARRARWHRLVAMLVR